MKIILFVHCFFPNHFYGTETYTLCLAKSYLALGHDVTIVTAIFQGEKKQSKFINRYFWEKIPVLSIDKNVLPHSSIQDTYFQFEMHDVLRKILIRLKPDVVHIMHLINHTSVLLKVTGELNIPTFTTLTDFFGFCFNSKLRTASGSFCTGPSSSRANCIICYFRESIQQSKYKNNYFNKLTIPIAVNIISKSLIGAQKIGLLKNSYLRGVVRDIVQRPETLSCLYNKYYKCAIAPTEFLKKLYEKNGIRVPITKLWFGVDTDRQLKPLRNRYHIPVIGYVGQIAPHKGVDLIINAFKKLPKNIAILKIYGSTKQSVNYVKELKKLCKNLNGILFMGTFAQSLTARIFQEIDLLVIPSRWYENSPLVLLNSLATHTPVLISDVEGMTEFLIEGKNGYSFKRNNIDDLTEKLMFILKTPGLLSKLSLTTEYLRTTETMARETLSLYQLVK